MPADAEYPDLRAYRQGSAADLHAGGDLRASTDDPRGSGNATAKGIHPFQRAERHDRLRDHGHPAVEEHAGDGQDIPQDRRDGNNHSGKKRDRECNGFINRSIGFNMRQLVHASLFSGFGAADLAAE